MNLLTQRPPYRPAFVKPSRPSRQTEARAEVAGSTEGSGYRDDNDKLWRYEFMDDLEIDTRAVTSAYGGVRSRVFGLDDAWSGSERKRLLNTWIDNYAAAAGAGERVGEATTKKKTEVKPVRSYGTGATGGTGGTTGTGSGTVAPTPPAGTSWGTIATAGIVVAALILYLTVG